MSSITPIFGSSQVYIPVQPVAAVKPVVRGAASTQPRAAASSVGSSAGSGGNTGGLGRQVDLRV